MGVESQAVKTCLVVDDSRVIRQVARRILEDRGFETAEASDGMEAMAWCRTAMPEAILLDWNMPVMDGLEFLKALRKEPEGHLPVVVFCTVENDLEHIGMALEAGANDFLMKPVTKDSLAEKLQLLGLID